VADGFFSMWDDVTRLATDHRAARDGITHRHVVDPPRPRPGEEIRLTLETSSAQLVDAARCLYTTDGSDPDAASATTFDLSTYGVEWDGVLWQYVRRWQGSIPPQPAGTMVRYTLAARMAADGEWVAARGRNASEQPSTDHALWIDDDAAPEWARAAILYQVFVDRFSPSPDKRWRRPKALDGFYGGTINGVTSRLDHIASLGCDVVWLSPIFASPTHHGYDTTDLYTVEPRLGTNDDFMALIDAAHSRGMRILLDLVPNHWSNQHPTFQHAQRHADSPYRDWYLWRDWPDDYETFWVVKEMPKLNLARKSPAREHLLEAAEHWLRLGVDGYRIDHAQGPPPDMYADLRRRCRAVKPDCWLFGEVVEGADYQRGFASALDGNLDFLLCWTLRRAFGSDACGVEEVAGLLAAHDDYFGAEFTRPSFLDNHDMERFLYHVGGDARALKIATLLLYTLPGPPVLYYGTEVGLSQRSPGGFEPSREPMLWGRRQDGDLRSYFRRLGELRREYALHTGARGLAALDADVGVLAYFRDVHGKRALVALNNGARARSVSVDASEMSDGACDRLGDASVRRSGDVLTVRLGPRSGALVV
jgi:cyclomaltodextrinase / maltogenic alpha-amylase / neopullulanase